jgi:hypothetical protein
MKMAYWGVCRGGFQTRPYICPNKPFSGLMPLVAASMGDWYYINEKGMLVRYQENLNEYEVDMLGDGPVRVYRASDPENPTIYRRGDVAEAEPAVQGWTMPVDEIFA